MIRVTIYILASLAFIIVGIALYASILFFGGDKLVVSFDDIEVSGNIENYIFEKESSIQNIAPKATKEIIWQDKLIKSATEYSIIFIHGFSTTSYIHEESVMKIADTLNANVFFTRLSGHGASYEGLDKLTAENLLRDTAEAVEIGSRIGNKVILIGHSLGGALSTLVSADANLQKKIHGLVLFAPANSGVTRMTPLMAFAALFLNKIENDPVEEFQLPINQNWDKHFFTTLDTSVIFEASKIIMATDEVDYQSITMPLIVFYDENDILVNDGKLRKNYEKWGGLKELHKVEASKSDPTRHMFPSSYINPHLDEQFVLKIKSWVNKNL